MSCVGYSAVGKKTNFQNYYFQLFGGGGVFVRFWVGEEFFFSSGTLISKTSRTISSADQERRQSAGGTFQSLIRREILVCEGRCSKS